MEQIQNQGGDPNEKSQEEELLKEPKADEVRNSVAEKFGLDPDIDGELLDKLTADKLEERKKLSTAIKQKRGWREKAEAHNEQKKEETPQPVQPQPKVEELEKVLDQKVKAGLEEQFLESLEISDELKADVKTYAKVNGVTVKQAFNSDYIKWKKEQAEAKQRVEDASIGGKHKTQARKDLSALKLEDFDLSTEEGRKDYEEYKELRKKKS